MFLPLAGERWLLWKWCRLLFHCMTGNLGSFRFPFIAIWLFRYPLNAPKLTWQGFEFDFVDFFQFISIVWISPLNRTFFQFESDGLAMSGHRRVLSRLSPIGISYKIPICAAVGEIWRSDQISNSSSFTLGSILKEM